MDKYEYKLKTEQMLKLMENSAYEKAADIADTIDWKKVRNATILTDVSDIYEKIGNDKKSYEVLNLAYHRAEGGSRKIIYRICSLALKTGNVDQAIDYYDDFMQIAPKDPSQYVLKYKILRARKAPLEQQIEALEEFKRAEYIEEWAYELARLYQEAGMTAECLEECDDLILWFSEGQFVFKAMELKMLHKPLTPSQQERYDHRFENIETVTEEIPNVVQHQMKKSGLSEDSLETKSGPEDEVQRSVSGEKGIGSTMRLEEALQSLLKPQVEAEKSGASEHEDQEDISGLETAIEEIESVIDLNLVKKLSKNPPEGERPDSDQAEEQISAGDIRTCLEKEDNMENKKKTAEPLLPADIQRLIDEIEGILPEEPKQKPVQPPVAEKEEPVVNMGEVTQQLRLDDMEEFSDESDDVTDQMEDIVLDEDGDILDSDEAVYRDSYESGDTLTEDRADDEGADALAQGEGGHRDTDILDYHKDSHEDNDTSHNVTDILGDCDEDFRGEAALEEYGEDFDSDNLGETLEEIFEEVPEEDVEDEFEEISVLEEYEEEPLPEEHILEEQDHEVRYEARLEELEEEDLGDDREEIEAGFEEEFRIDPKHAEKPDDREVPDEDKGMSILSETAPLSRKETAKMIATGKTAPLPVDEISDALSMSDTGFVVHGRYDLETQSGIGTRAGLTEEQKKLFSYFVPVRGMSEQLVDVLEQDRNCTNRKGTSNTGNLLIIGNKGNGKTVLAVDVVKAIQKQRDIRHGKVAIVTGDSLNKKRIHEVFSKLHGGALIIEKAGKLNEKTVAKLNKAMERESGELLIVLEEQRKPLDRLLTSNRDFRRKFTSRLEVPIFINDELVTFGQTYAKESGYHIDEMGILALYSRIDTLQREDHAVTVAEVKEIMDEAMEHSQKASAKKLMKRVLGKNTDSSDRILLSEKDFNL